MKRMWLGTMLFIAIVGLVTTGCDKAMNPLAEEGLVQTASHPVCGQPKVVTIWAGQHINAGTVTVINCTDYLYVKYQSSGDWKFTEMHLAVANNCTQLPRNKKGHLVPGQFPYSMTFSPPASGQEFTIPLGDWEPGDTIAIAAHAVVVRLDGNGNVIQEETGWGDVWKGCFRYVIQECYKDVDLPDYPVRMRGWHPFAAERAYWRIELSGVGTGFDVWDSAYWVGWCAEKNVYISQNTWYSVVLYSSQNPNLNLIPRLYKNGEWDRVNWLLNHRGNYPTATWSDFQNAMWYLLGEQNRPGGIAGTMADDAIANGDGFRPGPGGLVAVLMLDGPNTQLIFIEVDP